MRLSPAGAMVVGLALLVSACAGTATGQSGPTTTAASTTTMTPTAASVSTAAATIATDVAVTLCPGTGTIAHRDIAYDQLDGTAPNLLSLDVYEPEVGVDCPAPPVMIYVHGGAWVTGDKTQNVADKITWFNSLGWVLVSVNYRLTPDPGSADIADLDPDRIAYPVHNNDVADAVAWVHEHAAGFGADADSISIMGHSAGAGIISAIATDGSYLRTRGLGLDTLQCAVSLDTAAYDITARVEDSLTSDLYINAFGDSPEDWASASPLNHVGPGQDIPDFLVVVRGSKSRLQQAANFAAALTAAGVRSELLEATGLSHDGVNKAIGAPEDDLITPVLGLFLDGCR